MTAPSEPSERPDAAETPPSEAPVSLGGRLHPAAMAVWPLSQLGSLALLLVAGSLNRPVAAGLLVVALASGVVRYLRYTWRVDHNALVIEQGLLQRQRRVIPLDRVQTVDLVRKLRHRLFGVVEVRVEAVGAGSSEGRLDALAPADAQRLRTALLTRDPGRVATAEPKGEPEDVLVRMRPGQLVVAGLTGGRVGFAAALFGFAQEALGDRVAGLLERVPALGAGGLAWLAGLALLAGFLASLVATALAYWDHTVWREGTTLRIRRGLLEQRQDTLPLRRIQSLRVEENLARRLFGLAAVKVDVAGRAGGDEGRETGVLLPLGRRNEALALIARLLDEPALADVELEAMPRRARTRRLARAVVAVLAVTTVAVVAAGPPGFAALALLAPAAAAALAAYGALGHGEVRGVLVTRAGVVVRRTAFVRIGSVQSLALTTSPSQRLGRLATLELQIARPPGIWTGPRMLDLDDSVARRLLARLSFHVTQRHRFYDST